MTLAELERSALEKSAALADLSDVLVFGEGPPDADLMLIGEAPGEEEDRSGRPFVGRAGRLLDKILASVDLEREDVYITNLVKRRPPGNRNPTPDEIAASAEVLAAQVRLIEPKAIATLGNVPTKWFLNTRQGITRLHGTWHDYRGIPLMPLYHPAYLLRNPTRERDGPKWRMWEAMKELAAELRRAPERSDPHGPDRHALDRDVPDPDVPDPDATDKVEQRGLF